MAQKKIATDELAFNQDHLQQDEVDEVLSVLRRLYQKVTSPIIKSCLEAARTDIAYLADSGELTDEDDVVVEDDGEALHDDSTDEADAA
jgi:hypothetical protein